MEIKNVLCIGAGYVGGPTMAVIADKCKHIKVVVADLSKERIAQWNSDELPIFEPGLSEIVFRNRGRNLFFELIHPELFSEADIIFVSVNTPTKVYGEGSGMASDLSYWELAARDILKHARSGSIIVEKSTVPVKTAEAISRIINHSDSGKRFQVLSNPEFLAEGTAIQDLENPNRVLIGCEETEEGKEAALALKAVYANWVPDENILLTNVWSSELSKLVANAMLAQRVSSINSISALCESTNAQIKEISKAVGMDERIGKRFLEAGVGFGGSCFKKDILNLVYICTQQGLPEIAAYWKSVVDMNEYQMKRFVKLIIESQFNTISGKKLAIFGFAFKPDTNDTRDSPAILICKKLLEEKAILHITDPEALDNARFDMRGIDDDVVYTEDPYEAARGAHAIIINTHWKQYKTLDYKRIYESMEKPAFLFDGRIMLDKKEMSEIGFNVYQIGSRPIVRF
ncbi:MAG: nucleotide sugar dehydrogenase [Leptospiraceae bacterium]|nr:nucleotide sugar dehydrogenase [Leptospiraceae bacterium]MCP5499124.1 nucleotide sugar dehydrogenase [Leptospiraceae bacterium]